MKKDERELVRKKLATLPRLNLTDRQLYDLELILSGAFAPLEGFLEEDDYNSVVDTMHLKNGALWPIPVVLDIPKSHPYKRGTELVLCDRFGNPVAFFIIKSIYQPDKIREAEKVYGSTSTGHPGVEYLMQETKDFYLGGPVSLIAYSPKYDFAELRHTPTELREEFKRKGWNKVVAFQTRNPIHRAHYELIMRAMRSTGGKALIQPVVGLTKRGDIDYISRVRSYKRLVDNRMKDNVLLSLLPLAMRMAGPREAVWHALIRKNYGATHFIIGRDHAGPGKDSAQIPFYGPYAAQELAKSVENELGISIITSQEMSYVPEFDTYLPADELATGQEIKTISGTEFRRLLRLGEEVPAWFSFPEVIEELRKAAQKERRRGAVVFFTGLSGAGKSTIAHVLYNKLLEIQDRSVTLFDGDVVRDNLSRGLGFSREDRNINVERIGYVAAEIAKHGGIALCSAIAPYKEARHNNRVRIEEVGTYIEVYVATPLSVCEDRDTKGLYDKARRGELKQFTGIDDPYEVPEHPEITIDTTKISQSDAAETIIKELKKRGLIEDLRD